MFKFLFTSTVTLILLTLLTGCVSRSIHIDPNQHKENQYNVNDVDMSDLDENLTESEMMMTEEGEDENPGLTLSFDSFETLEKVFSGDQSAAMQAFMQGKVKFSGDMALGQKLGSVFKAPE